MTIEEIIEQEAEYQRVKPKIKDQLDKIIDRDIARYEESMVLLGETEAARKLGVPMEDREPQFVNSSGILISNNQEQPNKG